MHTRHIEPKKIMRGGGGGGVGLILDYTLNMQ